MIDAEVCIALCELCFFKLSVVICEDPLGYAESEYYTLQEFKHYLLSDVYYWHNFHSLGECVYCDK
jgi:hypothetical protein